MSEKFIGIPTQENSRTDWERLRNMTDDEIDYSDIPPLDDEFFANARWVMPGQKVSNVNLIVDDDVLDYFKSQGKGYQITINAVLRRYVEAQRKPAAR